MQRNDGSLGIERTLPDGLSLWQPAVVIATWFGSGLLPKAPGTWGSLAALPFAYGIQSVFGPMGLVVAALAAFIAGLWASAVYLRSTAAADPGAIVIDEVTGQWLALVFAGTDPLLFGLGFLLFRIADIWKPWPISWLDRSVTGGFGVMIDDVAAGVLAGGVLVGLKILIGG